MKYGLTLEGAMDCLNNDRKERFIHLYMIMIHTELVSDIVNSVLRMDYDMNDDYEQLSMDIESIDRYNTRIDKMVNYQLSNTILELKLFASHHYLKYLTTTTGGFSTISYYNRFNGVLFFHPFQMDCIDINLITSKKEPIVLRKEFRYDGNVKKLCHMLIGYHQYVRWMQGDDKFSQYDITQAS